VSGTASWQSRLVEAVLGALILIAVAILLRRGYRRVAMGVAIVAGIFTPWSTLFRGCGLLQWVALLRPRDRWMFALAALSIASTLRVALNVAPVWYGFVLIVPLYLLIANAMQVHPARSEGSVEQITKIAVPPQIPRVGRDKLDCVWLALIVALCG